MGGSNRKPAPAPTPVTVQPAPSSLRPPVRFSAFPIQKNNSSPAVASTLQTKDSQAVYPINSTLSAALSSLHSTAYASKKSINNKFVSAPIPKTNDLSASLYETQEPQLMRGSSRKPTPASTPVTVQPAPPSPRSPVHVAAFPIQKNNSSPVAASTLQTNKEASQAVYPINSTSSVALSSLHSSEYVSGKSINKKQQTQSPSDISAFQIVRFSANNYLIPNIDIISVNNRPFSDIANRRIKTERFVLHVCPKHISKEGCNIEHCFRFHVCHRWIRNNCNVENCSLDHNFQGKENIFLFHKVMSRKFGENELKERLRRNLFFKKDCKEDWSSCICMDFILKQCKRNVCESYHLNLLYSWQFFHKNSWHQFSCSQNKEIEKKFCDPSISFLTLNPQTSSDGQTKSIYTDLIFPNQALKIDLTNMQLTISNEMVLNVRRISTPSDVTVYKSVATRWLWYWNDDEGNWNFYTNAIVNDFVVLPFSDYIETQFLKKIKDFTFNLNQLESTYAINFEEMTQTDQRTQMKRYIRRRPMHSNYLKWKSDMSFKSLWSKSTAKEEFLRQKVLRTSPEFYFIQNMIIEALPVKEIFIQRVENSFLWEAYQIKKDQMMRTYGNDIQMVNEQYMFHGTSKDVIDKICAENFDWRLYGTKVGNVYGKGTYFSNTVRTANHYASTDNENYKWIFVALVLVGKATVGNSKMIIPPINPITNKRFDSTVNDKDCPQIFVKYNLDEYYPAFLVKLKTI